MTLPSYAESYLGYRWVVPLLGSDVTFRSTLRITVVISAWSIILRLPVHQLLSPSCWLEPTPLLRRYDY